MRAKKAEYGPHKPAAVVAQELCRVPRNKHPIPRLGTPTALVYLALHGPVKPGLTGKRPRSQLQVPPAPSLLFKPYHPSRLGSHAPSFGSAQTAGPAGLPSPNSYSCPHRNWSPPGGAPAPGLRPELGDRSPNRSRSAKDLPLHPHPLAHLFCLPEPAFHPGPTTLRTDRPWKDSQPLSARHGLGENRWPRRCWTCTKSTPSSPKPGRGLVPPSQRTAGLRESVGHHGPHLGLTTPPSHSKIPVPRFPSHHAHLLHLSKPLNALPSTLLPLWAPKACTPASPRSHGPHTSWVSLHPVHTQKWPGATTRIFHPWPLPSAHFDSPLLSGQTPGLQIPASTSNPQPHPGQDTSLTSQPCSSPELPATGGPPHSLCSPVQQTTKSLQLNPFCFLPEVSSLPEPLP